VRGIGLRIANKTLTLTLSRSTGRGKNTILVCVLLAMTVSYALAADSASSPDKSLPAPTFTDAARAHWAFQPVKRPLIPSVSQPSSVVNPIDSFVLARLQEKGLTFSPPASKAMLIRRVTFDLIGLPPTPAEIADFEHDASPDAYEKLLDRLLATPITGSAGAGIGSIWRDTPIPMVMSTMPFGPMRGDIVIM